MISLCSRGDSVVSVEVAKTATSFLFDSQMCPSSKFDPRVENSEARRRIKIEYFLRKIKLTVVLNTVFFPR